MPLSDILSKLLIATEADDITQRVADQMQGAGGNRDSAVAQSADAGTEGDLTQVDNIYDDAVNPNDGNDQNDQPQDDRTDDAQQDDQDNGGDDNSDPTSSNDDSSQEDDSSNDDNQDDETAAPASVYSDKNTLKISMITLSENLQGNLKSLNDMLNTLEDISDIRWANRAISNIQHCKMLLDTMITSEMGSRTYEELMTRYITIKRIYDLSIEMLEKHFNKDGKPRSPVNSRRSERKVV